MHLSLGECWLKAWATILFLYGWFLDSGFLPWLTIPDYNSLVVITDFAQHLGPVGQD